MESIAVETSDVLHAAEPIRRLEENVALVIRGKREVIRLALAADDAGDVLLEQADRLGGVERVAGFRRRWIPS